MKTSCFIFISSMKVILYWKTDLAFKSCKCRRAKCQLFTSMSGDVLCEADNLPLSSVMRKQKQCNA